MHNLENLVLITIKYLVTLFNYVMQKQHDFEKIGTEKEKNKWFLYLKSNIFISLLFDSFIRMSAAFQLFKNIVLLYEIFFLHKIV